LKEREKSSEEKREIRTQTSCRSTLLSLSSRVLLSGGKVKDALGKEGGGGGRGYRTCEKDVAFSRGGIRHRLPPHLSSLSSLVLAYCLCTVDELGGALDASGRPLNKYISLICTRDCVRFCNSQALATVYYPENNATTPCPKPTRALPASKYIPLDQSCQFTPPPSSSPLRLSTTVLTGSRTLKPSIPKPASD